MRKWWKQLLILLLLVGGYLLYRHLGWDRYLTFDFIKGNRAALHEYVEAHHVLSVAVFIAVYVTAALFVPGAIVLTLAGGFLFGVVQGALYVDVGATIGAVLALLASRHFVGTWIQAHYTEQLKTFNLALERHGVSYLLTLRIIPVLPFFAVNYLAGLTRIPLKTFIWTTSLGMFPGSLIYAYAGRQLGSINRPEDIMSPELLAALGLLAFFSLLPPLVHYLKRLRSAS